MKRTTLIIVSLVALTAAAVAWDLWGPVATPVGQPPLAEIGEQTLDQLRAEFNAAADRPRIVALLSPT